MKQFTYHMQKKKKQINEVCHVWRNTRLIFRISDTGTVGELGALTPKPLALSITAKQFGEKNLLVSCLLTSNIGN